MLSISNIEFGLLIVSTLFFIYLCLRDLSFYGRPVRAARQLSAEPEPETEVTWPSVSVIICASNEAEHLRQTLPLILEQDYPNFEVIVVNVGSTDDTDELLSQFKARYEHLYYSYTPQDTRYLSQRKLALTIGIKAAKNERLLFTEAFCEPVSPHWIKSMMNAGQEVVIGYCRYNHKRGLADRLIAYDNLLRGLRYLSSTLVHHPYAGDGRNLSYPRKLFFQHKGFSSSLYLNRGDDDLFINEIANSKNTQASLNTESHTTMARYDSLKLWFERKASLIATQQYYKGYQVGTYRFDTAFYYLFNIAAILTVIVGILNHQPLLIAAGALQLLARYAIRSTVLFQGARLLGQTFSPGWLILLEPSLPIIQAFVRLFRLFNKKKDYTYYVPD